MSAQTMFDRPQWHWERDENERHYAFVPNKVEVSPDKREDHYCVLVAIPSEFFKLLLDLGIEQVDNFYLDQTGKRWLFGFDSGSKFYDLWYYTASTRPVWSMEYYKVD